MKRVLYLVLVVGLAIGLSGCKAPKAVGVSLEKGEGKDKIAVGVNISTDAVRVPEKKMWTEPVTEIGKMVQEIVKSKKFVSVKEAFAKAKVHKTKK